MRKTLAPIVKDTMTKEEKKHFILQSLSSDNLKFRSANTSQLALCVNPPLSVNEVNILCREMESEVPLKIISDKNSGETFDVLQTQVAIDAFKTGKYLNFNTIENIEFELLNFLNNKDSNIQIRINHILVSSTLTVIQTCDTLKKMVEANIIRMNPQPLSLRQNNDNKLIDNHEQAFENIHRPIKASITITGKSYFKDQYLHDDSKATYQFNGPTNFTAGHNNGSQQIGINDLTNKEKEEKKTFLIKVWNLVSKNPLISGLLILVIAFFASLIWNKYVIHNAAIDIGNKLDTTTKTR